MIATNSQTNVPHLNAGEIANLALVAANRVAVFHRRVILAAQHPTPIRIACNLLCDDNWIFVEAFRPSGLW
jgi:hypothetical protein